MELLVSILLFVGLNMLACLHTRDFYSLSNVLHLDGLKGFCRSFKGFNQLVNKDFVGDTIKIPVA